MIAQNSQRPTDPPSEKVRPLELRVAAGSPEGKFASGIWRIWQNRDDIYIAPRSVAGSVKASLHWSRNCYFGFTSQFAERLTGEGLIVPRREWVNWKRPETPDNQYLWALEIWLAPGPLFEMDKIDKPILRLEPPPDGKAVVISIGFSRIPKGEATIAPDVWQLGHSQLSTGEYVVVFARTTDFDYAAFKAQHGSEIRERFSRGRFPGREEQILRSKHPRMFVINDPEETGYLKVLDAAVTFSPGPTLDAVASSSG
jgi:hypothetical protein